MGFWWWVLIFVGIAVAGCALYALLGLQLWRKFQQLMAEVGRLTRTVSELEAAIAVPSGGSPYADEFATPDAVARDATAPDATAPHASGSAPRRRGR